MRQRPQGTELGIAVVFALTLGATAALAAMPALFARVPHDLRRIGLLLRTLDRGEEPPSIVAFGNSVAMCGIDAGRLEHALGGARAWNLSSTGQTLAESVLYYQELPEVTHTIVYAIAPTALESGMAFNSHVYNAFLLSGYSIAPWTRRAIEAAFPAEEVAELYESDLAQRFEARWVVRELVDSGVRQRVRRDLNLERAYADLNFPAPYTTKVSERALDAELARRIAARRPGPLVPDASQTALLGALLERARQDGRRVVLVFAPVHPRLRATWGPEYLTPLRGVAESFRSSGAEVVDSTELLDAASFIDAVHPTPEGAGIWTSAIAAALSVGR